MRKVDLAGVFLGIGEELGHRFGGKRWIYLHHERHANDDSYRRYIADGVILEVVIEARIDRVGDGHQEQRISVGGRIHDRFSGNVARGTRPVLDDEGLMQPFRQILPHDASGDVAWAAWWKAHDPVHRSRRISLPFGNP